MSKNIAISDDVYNLLRQRKAGKSFSEVIREALQGSAGLQQVVGKRTLDPDRVEAGRAAMAEAGKKTLDRMRDAS